MSRYGIKNIFLGIVSEGGRAGTKAVFVHFTGCNLWDGNPLSREDGCSAWCDADFAKGEVMGIGDLLNHMGGLWGPKGERWCVLSGGEPGEQLDAGLVDALHDNGWRVTVETNGTVSSAALSACDYVIVSPKRGTEWTTIGPETMSEVRVIYPGAPIGKSGWTVDELEAVGSVARMALADLFIQPQDPIIDGLIGESALVRSGDHEHEEEATNLVAEQLTKNVAWCVAWVHEHPSWRFTFSTHKLIPAMQAP